ncbi:MAG TPA: DUF6152 family protein [Terriglobia bacterium]|nr:DUF6152 family protein [Terriglobia bacterium]
MKRRSSSLLAGTVIAALLAALLAAPLAAPLAAHHSFEAQFDRNKPVTLIGSVTKLDWINPHARIFMEVKDAATGKAVKWEIELGAPAMLLRNGWTRNSIAVGEVVTVAGSLAKDGSNMANARTVKLANGKQVFAGSSGGDAAPNQN